MVGLLRGYSRHDAQHLRRVIERIESTPKRALTSPNATIQPRSLNRRLSPATIAELVEAYRTGSSANQLCRRYGLSKGGVLDLLAVAGVTMRHQGMNDEAVQQAVDLYDSGHSLRTIGIKLGHAKSTVRSELQKRGVVFRSSGRQDRRLSS